MLRTEHTQNCGNSLVQLPDWYTGTTSTHAATTSITPVILRSHTHHSATVTRLQHSTHDAYRGCMHQPCNAVTPRGSKPMGLTHPCITAVSTQARAVTLMPHEPCG